MTGCTADSHHTFPVHFPSQRHNPDFGREQFQSRMWCAPDGLECVEQPPFLRTDRKAPGSIPPGLISHYRLWSTLKLPGLQFCARELPTTERKISRADNTRHSNTS